MEGCTKLTLLTMVISKALKTTKKGRTAYVTLDKHGWGGIVQIINVQYLASVLSYQ